MQTVQEESTMIIQFDKYRFIKGLSRDNLYTAEQAERIAEELESALSPSPRMLATKDDLREVNTKLESNIEQFGTKLESEIEQFGTKLESEIEQFGTKLGADLAQVHTEMKAMEYRLETLITKSQKQLLVLVTSMIGIATTISVILPLILRQ